MFYEKVIEGRYVDLKSCTEEDAEFTLAIRQNPKFTKFLPRIDNTIEQQKAWIRKQREVPGDYFFVIWDKKGTRIGTVGLFVTEDKEAETNRLTMLGDSFEATESIRLLCSFGFDVLSLNDINCYIFADNKRAIRFNKMFGFVISEPFPCLHNEVKNSFGRMIVKGKLTHDDFKIVKQKIEEILY